jgi:hypothetical protein
MDMNTKFLTAALTLLGLGGAAIGTNAQAKWIGADADPGVTALTPAPSQPQALRPDALLKTTNAGLIGVTEQTPNRNFEAVKFACKACEMSGQ